jgi:uncharacterized protein (TIGR01777 family)
MSTILITGGTGLVGTALTPQLIANGHEVIILTRTPNTSTEKNISYATWDVKAQTLDNNAIAKADYIIHLAGAGVADKRWTEERKKEIVESRTESSKLLIKALKQTPNKVKAVISASAIGWYGDDKNLKPKKKCFTEDDLADSQFLGETCRLWEESINSVEQTGIRLVKLRTGIVLSNNGGALTEFKKPLHFGIAAILGSGKQVISWIHIEDLCRMFIYAIENEALHGAYNAVAPAPLRNKELTLTLAQKIRGRFFIPLHVPAFALKLILGEMSVEVLKSATVSSDKIQAAGFTFLYRDIEGALKDLIREWR